MELGCSVGCGKLNGSSMFVLFLAIERLQLDHQGNGRFLAIRPSLFSLGVCGFV